jgi:Zn-dependent protease
MDMSNALGQLDLAELVIWCFVFIYTTVLHEAGHAWAALKLGDRTAYEGGQVSLDPIPHIAREPFGMIVVPIFSWFYYGGAWMIGWASAPYDPNWAQHYPRRAAWMAMAGPAANLMLLVLSGFLLRAGLENGLFVQPESLSLSHIVEAAESSKLWSGLATFLSITFSVQLVLAPFNLLPLPPLDGSAIPCFFLRGQASEKYQEFIWSPQLRFIGLFVAWQVFGRIFPYIWHTALRLLY